MAAADWSLRRQRISERGDYAVRDRRRVRPKDRRKKVRRPTSQKRKAVRRREMRATQGHFVGRQGVITAWNVFFKEALARMGHRGAPSKNVVRDLRNKWNRLLPQQQAPYRKSAKRKTIIRQSAIWQKSVQERGLSAVLAPRFRLASTSALALTAADLQTTLAVRAPSVVVGDALVRISEAQAEDNRRRNAKEQARRQQALELSRSVSDDVRVASPQALAPLAASICRSLPSSEASILAVACNVKICRFLDAILKKSTGEERSAFTKAFAERVATIKAEECESMGKVDARRLKVCYFACRCLCPSGPTPMLAAIEKAFRDTVRQAFPSKTANRISLQAGDIATRIFAPGSFAWFHISYINLTTMATVLVTVAADPDDRRKRRAAPGKALVVCNPIAPQLSWDGLSILDPAKHWKIDFWKVYGAKLQVDAELEVRCFQARPLLGSKAFWPPPSKGGGGAPGPGAVAPVAGRPPRPPLALCDGPLAEPAPEALPLEEAPPGESPCAEVLALLEAVAHAELDPEAPKDAGGDHDGPGPGVVLAGPGAEAAPPGLAPWSHRVIGLDQCDYEHRKRERLRAVGSGKYTSCFARERPAYVFEKPSGEPIDQP